MESEAVRRRMNMIAAHFASGEDISPTHLLPMICSSSLNSAIPRRDNRMYFARQGSASQSFFMRQALTTEQPGGGVPSKCSASEAPLFSRPTRVDQILSSAEPIKTPESDCKSPVVPDLGPPNFARPNTCIGKKMQSHAKNKIRSALSNNGIIEWSPRMDVAESGSKYVVTVEIPGVNVDDIRVEVNDRNLMVMGKRCTQFWTRAGCSKDSISSYHKREILQGPYQVLWPFPSDANKESVSAEFM